jgi:hypothetical protein
MSSKKIHIHAAAAAARAHGPTTAAFGGRLRRLGEAQ